MKYTIVLVLAITTCAAPGIFRFDAVASPSGHSSSSQSTTTATKRAGLRFYVSPEGNDAWSGKLDHPNREYTDGPFRTLIRARDAIRSLKAAGPLHLPVTVSVRGGVYSPAEPISFTPQDSGTQQAPITYSAYPGETPILSGGTEIRGWAPYTGSEFAPSVRRRLWVASVPEVRNGSWYFHELFVNGQRRTRARMPNQGFFHVDGLVSNGSPAHFKFHGSDIQPQWSHENDVEVVVLQAWAELRMPITAVDEAAHTVSLSGPRQPSNTEKNARYWVENAPDALDAPGEWYLDRKAGLVYYYPMPGEGMAHAQVVAPRLDQLILFKGDSKDRKFVSYLKFEGFTFSYTDWSLPKAGYADLQAAYDISAAVSGSGVKSSDIERCKFTHLGGYSVEFDHGSSHDRISGSEMTDLGAGGIKIGDPAIPANSADQTGEMTISDNHIHNIGKVYPAAVGVWVGQSGGNIIAHNEINDTYYTPISVGWTWGYEPTPVKDNLIEFNNLYDIGQGMLSDMGCIYTLGVQPGTVERNNLCHDVSRYKYGGWGLYTDEGSSDILIENNVVYRTEDGGFHQNYGENNTIRNNIFALGENAQLRRTHNENHLSYTFEHNIVYWKDGELLDGAWSDNNYRFDHNLYYSVSGEPIHFLKWSLAEWRKRGQDIHSIVADPLFRDPAKGDFRMDAASPAATIGFHPIDLSTVGPSGLAQPR